MLVNNIFLIKTNSLTVITKNTLKLIKDAGRGRCIFKYPADSTANVVNVLGIVENCQACMISFRYDVLVTQMKADKTYS